MVRLVEPLPATGSITTSPFQFHYGTIGRILFYSLQCRNFMFQFHYGTIGSHFYFSTGFVNRRFNSTMVRLVVNSGFAPLKYFSSFQFHYGTIGRLPIGPGNPPMACFNSTMVRLVGILLLFCLSFITVSIPLWYDW